jgi:hypothetical protein
MMIIRVIFRKRFALRFVRDFDKGHNHSNLYERAKLHTVIIVRNRGKPRNTVLYTEKYGSAKTCEEE